jgi:hypothetical protein
MNFFASGVRELLIEGSAATLHGRRTCHGAERSNDTRLALRGGARLNTMAGMYPIPSSKSLYSCRVNYRPGR